MTRITTLTHLTDDLRSVESRVKQTPVDHGHLGNHEHALVKSAVVGKLPGDPKTNQSPESLELLLSVYDTLLDRFMPPLILINACRRVVDTFSGADRFLRFGTRRPSEDVLDLLVEPLRESVRKAFALCCSTGQTVVTEPIVIEFGPENHSQAFSGWSTEGSVDESSVVRTRQAPANGESASNAEWTDKRYCVAQKFRVRVASVSHRRDGSPFFSIAFEPSQQPGSSASRHYTTGSTNETSYSAYRGFVDFGSVSSDLVCEQTATELSRELVSKPDGIELGMNATVSEAPDWDSLFEANGLAIIFLNAELKICRFSGPAGQIFGLLPHDIGRAMRTFAGNLDSCDLIDRLTQAVRTGDTDEFEIHQSKTGEYYLARIAPLTMASSSGMLTPSVSGERTTIEGVALTLIDLTSLGAKHQEVNRLSSIVQSSADAIISRDCEDRIVTWNAAAEHLYGYSATEAIGESVNLIVPDCEVEEHQNSQRVFRRDPHTNHFDAARRTKSGKVRRVSVRLSPVYDDENRVVGISTIERDVTDKVEIADRLSQSEKMLEAFYAQSPESYCLIDTSSGLITCCNDSMCQQLGFKREEIVGRSVVDLQTENCREKARACIDRLRTVGMLHGEDLELRRSDGGFMPVSLCATAIYDCDGKVVGCRAVWRDLTPLRFRDELIRQGEARYQSSFQHSAIGITHCDLDGQYLLANRRFCDIVGYSTEELSGKTFFDITHPDDLHREMEMRRRLAAQEIETYQLEKRYIHQSGRLVWVSVFVSLERDSQGKPIATHSYIEDISSRKELEDELRSAIRQRDQFLAMLSHELRNPLGAILNTCAVLGRRKNFSKNLQGPIAIVTRQARQMAELLDDLLDVSRITTGKIKLEKAPIELSQIADEAVESQQALAASRGQRLAVTYCDEPLQVFGDRSRLVQVVVNLLNNAIKYTGDGGAISVLLEKHGRVGRIRVKDNGVGLEPEQIESLFEMFAQKDATLDRSGGGMGLGLHLVRKLVDFHSGRVIGHSEGLGKGSEFIVELPLSARKASEPRAPRVTNVTAQRSKIKRIVVVEDIDDARRMLVALLEADNYQVYSAADGEAGLAMILRERPDLAIVDIGLPKLDGYEVARRVRLQIPAGELRLVALTGYGQDSDHENVMSAGFDTHLVKPLNHTRLEKILAGM
ncbi:MAG TPA: hypothetical protein DDZ51_13640 [Planctomycetaceae bacterium]|nr:hypothetical protein [Planctomycetaceae bacterium]